MAAAATTSLGGDGPATIFGDTLRDAATVARPPTRPAGGHARRVRPGARGHRGQRPSTGDGNDLIIGGAGVDTISAGGARRPGRQPAVGDDLVCGQEGDDVLLGGDGADGVWGGTGARPRLRRRRGSTCVFGNADDDALYGQADADVIEGNNGADWATRRRR